MSLKVVLFLALYVSFLHLSKSNKDIIHYIGASQFNFLTVFQFSTAFDGLYLLYTLLICNILAINDVVTLDTRKTF